MKQHPLPLALKRILCVPLFLLFLLPLTTRAQQAIKGKVSDDAKNPLAGVSIAIKNTHRGTVTAPDGSYSITAANGETLVFTFIGYNTLEITVNPGTQYNINLAPNVQNLDQMVVIGYGTQKKSSLTGSVASVNGKTLNELPVASVQQALQGRVPGVTVTNNGAPGTDPIVRIRGISSISYASDPLYVIDGFPTSNLTSFDSKDVLSVEVLKDASAAAIYGSRATNGVVIITTKKGTRSNKAEVRLDTYTGVQTAWKKIDLLNTQQYLQYERALNGAAGISKPPRLEDANWNSPIYDGTSQTYAQTNTDWQDAYFKSGLITQSNLSVSGGNDRSTYYMSSGYFKQDGIAQGVNYERGNFRINSEHNISRVFKVGENLLVAYSNQRYDNTSGNRTRLANVIRALPYLPVYDPTTQGGFRNAENSVDGADPTNPVEDALLLGDAHRKLFKLLGTVYAQVNFTPWLSFRSVFGADYAGQFQHQFTPIYNDKGRNSTVASINDQRANRTTLLYTEQLTLDKHFGRHHVNAIAVFERQPASNYGESQTGNQSTNDIETLVGATNVSAYSTTTATLIQSYIGRLNYEFGEKYLLSAAIRRDGLSVWAPGKKFQSFPSVSAGWRIDQESFMKPVTAVSELKLRGGWGVTGLNAIGIFPALQNSILANEYPWQAIVQANGATYPFGNTISVGNASYYNQLASADLEWEKTKQVNVGLDLGLFDNTITFTAEWYRRLTDNLILTIPTPPSFGYGGAGSQLNAASMKNTGVDLALGYNKTKGAFRWNVNANIGFIRNKILSLNTPNATIDAGSDADFGNGNMTRTVAGQPIQSFYGYVTDGIFQSQAEVDKGPVQLSGTDPAKSTAPGDIRFKDLNGDGSITSADRTFLGSYVPNYSYSLNYNANWHQFDLSVFFQGVQGNKIYNGTRVLLEGMARLFGAGTEVLNAWTPEHTNTDIPRAISGDPNSNLRVSNRWIEDGSYLRLKNLMIGYTLRNGAIRYISSFRVYVSSQNLLTFTKYKGWDPEIGSKNTTLTNGIDYGQYPAARSFQLGLQVGF
ncbi:MAG: TonB-dependent receptor plug [Bacteroidetes bacterium]|uniref:SusC/RagA family TonB-linked outer membrane protein n=1 Tax=unclassified Chitinophaga TaxID=2619133 RepID=UPI0009D10580|nr:MULTISPECIES: TonB-dependent receptor [unclassified Chitinophaga]MBP1651562.1 TonB-dependent receptor plug [Bacteroidota bacterium]OMP78564.1 SusC/RagA family TonB-linked outer membrane protein [[Flexibacter] sp. ATCC 35208]WPV64727.1 TonB-dependent receptor [Chitinophaga sp. LS1]